MTSSAANLVNLILSSPKHKKHEYKVIDATALFHDVMIFMGIPTEAILERSQVSTYYDTISQEYNEDMVTMKELIGADLIKNLGQPKFIEYAQKEYKKYKYDKNGNLKKEYFNENYDVSFADFVCIPEIMCSVISQDESFKFLQDMSDYMAYVNLLLSAMNNETRTNNGSLAYMAFKELDTKYVFSIPFDHCIFIMDELAFVYDRISDGQATMKSYAPVNNKLELISNSRFRLNEYGAIYNFVENDEIVKEYGNEERNIAKLEAFLKSKTSQDIIIRIINVGVIFDTLKRSAPEMYEKMTHFHSIAEYSIGVYENFMASNDPNVWAKIAYLYHVQPLNFTLAIAVLMMTCKQVRLREKTTFTKKVQNPKKKGKNKGGSQHQKITYSTISIQMEDQIVDKKGNYICEYADEDSDGEKVYKVARHMRRGHFAYYSPDKPLFGRTSGLIWRAPTIVNAGNKRENKADYVVKI